MLVFLGLVSHDLFFPHIAIKKRKELPLKKVRKKSETDSTQHFHNNHNHMFYCSTKGLPCYR